MYHSNSLETVILGNFGRFKIHLNRTNMLVFFKLMFFLEYLVAKLRETHLYYNIYEELVIKFSSITAEKEKYMPKKANMSVNVPPLHYINQHIVCS